MWTMNLIFVTEFPTKEMNVNFNVVSNDSWYISGESFVKHFLGTCKTQNLKQNLFSRLCFLQIVRLDIMLKLTLIRKVSH